MRIAPAPAALRLAALLLLSGGGARPLAGQTHVHEEEPRGASTLHVGVSATALVTRAAPALAGETYVEGYLTQPVLAAEASFLGGRLTASGMLNLEGLTLERGELTAGMWGEGYVDRRHPHTYLHELVFTAGGALGGGAVSLGAGRGFAPFGTDDPMARPFVKFPLNHHLAQLPERLLAVAAFRRGPIGVEVGLFTGAEPVGAGDSGTPEGFGASRSARLTLHPAQGLELQASTAHVAADPALGGTGLEHGKYSISARAETPLAGLQPLAGVQGYALLEWARTNEKQGSRRIYTFESVLAEAAARSGPWQGALRVERSTRPEQDRLADPFRTPHPHDDTHLVGVTRWLVVSARAEHRAALGALRLAPFVEASWQRVEELTGSIFDPVEQYGSSSQWHLSAGVALGAGMAHARMGRYGAARANGH